MIVNIRKPVCTSVILILAIFFSSCVNALPEESKTKTDYNSELTGTTVEETVIEEYHLPDGAALLTDYESYTDEAKLQSGKKDWAPALTKALSEADTVYIPAGEYTMSTVAVPSGKTICGKGRDTIIYQAAGSDRIFNIEGSRPKLSDLACDMDPCSDTFYIKDDIGLRTGDTVWLLSQRNALILEDCGKEWCLGRSYALGTACFYSEFLTVSDVTKESKGIKVKTNKSAIFPYYYADGTRESDPLKPISENSDWPYKRNSTTVYLVDFADNITLRDFDIREASGFSVYALWARNLTVENVNMSTSGTAAPDKNMAFVRLLDCLDCEVKNCSYSVPVKPDIEQLKNADGFDAYNMLVILSSQNCGFNGCSVDFATHGFIIGKKHKNGVSVGCYIKECTASDVIWSGVFVSQGTHNTEISGNTFKGCPNGILCAGRGALICDNIVNCPDKSPVDYFYLKQTEGGTAGITLTEGYGIDCTIRGNKLSQVDTGILIRDGYEKTNIFEGGSIKITDNTVNGCKRAMMIYKNSANLTTSQFSLQISGNTFIAGLDAEAAISVAGRNSGLTVRGNIFEGFQSYFSGINYAALKNTLEPNEFN